MEDEAILFGICSSRDLSARARAKLLEQAIEAGADVNRVDRNGVSALHFAVRFRHPEAVRLLLLNGARVNCACKKSGSTPLHRAVTNTGAPGTAGKRSEMAEIVTLLIDAGADASLRNKNGKTALDYANDASIISLIKSKIAQHGDAPEPAMDANPASRPPSAPAR